MKSTNRTAAIAGLIGGMILAPGVLRAEESAAPIRIAVNNWASQQVLSHITGTLLSDAGYNVEYHRADSQTQFAALGNGELHVQMEVWQGTMETPFQEQLSRERVVDAGTLTVVSREDWWYPEYVEALCPGLPDWRALNECKDLFSTAATEPRGRYLAGPVDWERPDRERIEALGLDFEVVHVRDPVELWGALDQAWRNKQPILMMNWTPNWTETPYPGKFVEFPMPGFEGECEKDAAWGENPQLTHDCGNPQTAWLKKALWSGFAERWSCAAELIGAIDVEKEQLVEAAALAEVEEMSPEQAALSWIGEHRELVESWMPACAASLALSDAAGASAEAAAAADSETAAAPVDAEALAESSNCLSCHGVDQALVGPAFTDVAAKYTGTADAADQLVGKVLDGGVGNWGEIPMPPNAVSEEDAGVIVDWVLAR